MGGIGDRRRPPPGNRKIRPGRPARCRRAISRWSVKAVPCCVDGTRILFNPFVKCEYRKHRVHCFVAALEASLPAAGDSEMDMPLHPSWPDIALRLVRTVVAGTIVGINRESGGHSAGFRTTVLVSLAAALSMIQANILLGVAGKTSESFAVM